MEAPDDKELPGPEEEAGQRRKQMERRTVLVRGLY